MVSNCSVECYGEEQTAMTDERLSSIGAS